MSADKFWESVPLAQMTKAQWESLCDGCARCCLQKLQDEDDERIYYTDVVCRYLDDCGRCSHYQERQKFVPDCVWLSPADAHQFHWLPDTCAYRLVAEGKPLADWHPLICGNQEAVKSAGISVLAHELIRDDQLPEEDWQDRIIEWVQYD